MTKILIKVSELSGTFFILFFNFITYSVVLSEKFIFI